MVVRKFTALLASLLVFGAAICWVLIGCGGQTGGLPSGIGGVLVNGRLNAAVVSVPVSQGTTFIGAGIIGAISSYSRESAQATDMVVSVIGGGYNGEDVEFQFPLSSGGKQLYFDGRSDGIRTQPEYAIPDRTSPRAGFNLQPLLYRNNESEPFREVYDDSIVNVTLTELNSDPPLGTDLYKLAQDTGKVVKLTNSLLRQSSNQPAFLRQGTFDMSIAFLKNPADVGPGESREYHRIYYKRGIRLEAANGNVMAFHSSETQADPALRFAQGVNLNIEVAPVPANTDSILVIADEQKIPGRDSSQAQYRKIVQVFGTPGSRPETVELPIVNRLRRFKVTAFALLKNDGSEFPAVETMRGLFKDSGGDFLAVPIVSGAKYPVTGYLPIALEPNIESDSFRGENLVIGPGGSDEFRMTCKVKFAESGETLADRTLPNNRLRFEVAPDTTDIAEIFETRRGRYEVQSSASSGSESVKITLRLSPPGVEFTDTRVISISDINTGTVAYSVRGLADAGRPNKAGSMVAFATYEDGVEGQSSPSDFAGYSTSSGYPNSFSDIRITPRSVKITPRIEYFSEANGRGIKLYEVKGDDTTSIAALSNVHDVPTPSHSGVSNIQDFGGLMINGTPVADGQEYPVELTRGTTVTLTGSLKTKSPNSITSLVPSNLFTITQEKMSGESDDLITSISADGKITMTSGSSSKDVKRVKVNVVFHRGAGQLNLIRSLILKIKPNLGSGSGIIK